VAVTLYDHEASICSQMARVTLHEKGVAFDRRRIDIGVAANEQFAPWYVALNPRAVVPTLKHDDAVVTDTLRICAYVDRTFEGPALCPADPDGRDRNAGWMRDIMAPHYGVLLYGPLVDEDGRCGTIDARHHYLETMLEQAPEQGELLRARLAGNERFTAILKDPTQRQGFVDACRRLVVAMDDALANRAFLVDDSFRIADAFAMAAVARFESHGYAHWWEQGALPRLAAYYERVQQRPSWTAAGVLSKDLNYDG